MFCFKRGILKHVYIGGLVTSKDLPLPKECNETYQRVRSAFSCIASYL